MKNLRRQTRDPQAFQGWVRTAPREPWRMVCTALGHAECVEMLQLSWGAHRFGCLSMVVLPRGEVPSQRFIWREQ